VADYMSAAGRSQLGPRWRSRACFIANQRVYEMNSSLASEWFGRAFHGALIEWLSDARSSDAHPPHEHDDAAADYPGHILGKDVRFELSAGVYPADTGISTTEDVCLI
jgi:hypothetical protein